MNGASDESAPPGVDSTLPRGILLGYLILLMVLAPQIFLHPATRIICNHGDGFNAMLWWYHAAKGTVFKGWTTEVFYPFGVNLGTDKGYWLIAFMTVPLQRFLSLPVIYNLLCVFFFCSTAWMMARFARAAGASVAGAVVAGALLVLSAPYLCELSQGSTEMNALQWLLGFLIVAETAYQQGLRGRTRLVRVSEAWWLVVAGLTNWYQLVYAALFCLVMPVRRLRRPLVLALLVLVLPVSFGLGKTSSLSGHYRSDVYRGERARRVVPTATGIDYGETMSVIYDSVDYGNWLNRVEPKRMAGALPGWTLVTLALIGLVRRPKACWRWGVLAALCLVASLGPCLHFRGLYVCSLPWEWVYERVGLMTRLRPCRFLMPEVMCLALCAAHALPDLTPRWKQPALVALLVGLAGYEELVWRVSFNQLDIANAQLPAWYETLATIPDGAVLEAPGQMITLQVGKQLYAQSIHHHPIVNYDFIRPANLMRLEDAHARYPILDVLWGRIPSVPKLQAQELRTLGVRWVLLHGEVESQGQRIDQDEGFSDLFDSGLYNRLRGYFGDPLDTGDGLWVFDVQTPRPARLGNTRRGAWKGRAWASKLQRTSGSGEIQVWLRGRGLTPQVWTGNEVLTQGKTLHDDNWHWVRLEFRTRTPVAPTVFLTIDGVNPKVFVGEPSLYEYESDPPSGSGPDGEQVPALPGALPRPTPSASPSAGSWRPPGGWPVPLPQ